MGTRRRALVIVGLLVAAACTKSAPRGASVVAPSTAVPEVTTATVTTTASPADPCGSAVSLASPDPNRPVYTATATVDPVAGTVDGTISVQFVPDLPVDELVWRLWANAPNEAAGGAHIAVTGLGGSLADPDDPTTVHAPLGHTSPPGAAIDASMTYHLDVRGNDDDRVARDGDTMRLGSFLPLLAWEPGKGWATEPPTVAHGETATSPAADYDVALTVPTGYDVLATGEHGPDGHWRASAVRDFAASLGHFRVVDANVGGVRLVVGVDRDVDEDPHRDLDLLVTAMQHYESRLSAFPWPSVTVAITPGFHGGIEFPLLIMQSPGSAVRSVVHELAHQWFYGLVGNDQARDPWIDEGLASYVEFVEVGSLERNAAVTVPAAVSGHAGDPMTFWDHHTDDYYVGLYVQAAEAVAALGDVDRVDCALRQFVARNAYRIATPADFFDAVAPIVPDAEAQLASAGIHR